jgi:PAS domain S-box-containing protein
MTPDAISFERLQTAVDAAGVGTWDYDLLANTLTWSNRCKELFGLPSTAEVTYDDFLALLYPPDRAATEAAVAAAYDPAGSGTYDIEYRTYAPATGQVLLWARATGRAFFDEDRTKAQRFIGTITDITPQKNMQAQLQEAYSELEQKVIFRNLELEREVQQLRAQVQTQNS